MKNAKENVLRVDVIFVSDQKISQTFRNYVDMVIVEVRLKKGFDVNKVVEMIVLENLKVFRKKEVEKH